MAPASSPAWRRAFDTVERAVAGPLERGSMSSEFAVGTAAAGRLRRSVGRRIDAAGSWALHQLALPSRRDVRGLQRQLANVERELGALRRQLDQRSSEGGESS